MIKLWGMGKLILCLLMVNNVCAGEKYYALSEFIDVNKVDAHVHVNTDDKKFIELAIKNNFKLISINVDYPDFPTIDEQFKFSYQFSKEYPQVLAFVSTFSMKNWNDKTWTLDVIDKIKRDMNAGAIAVKVWKNIGMDYRNDENKLVMLDDPKFTSVFDFLSQQGMPLIGHQGEPKNCWLPVSEMTVLNDQRYFAEHPQYHMYLHPELPSYEDQMNVRDRVLTSSPTLKFIGAHMASIEWSVDELGLFLDRFPLAAVDMAARMGQIQFQSQRDYDKVRNFFIKYQDRLLYATDLTYQPEHTNDAVYIKEFSSSVENRWRSDWQYLSSNNEMGAMEIKGHFSGLHLPRKVIDKIYHLNAEHVYQSAFK